jgi:hypothetical protein
MIFTISVLDTVLLDTIYTNYTKYIRGRDDFYLARPELHKEDMTRRTLSDTKTDRPTHCRCNVTLTLTLTLR